jgi:hypothetical protein
MEEGRWKNDKKYHKACSHLANTVCEKGRLNGLGTLRGRREPQPKEKASNSCIIVLLYSLLEVVLRL